MTFSLFQIPQHLILQILRRMEIESLCRIRRTCKEFDEFAERNRFQISTRCEHSKWVLLVEMGDEKGEDYLKYSINRREIIDFGEAEWWSDVHQERHEEEFEYRCNRRFCLTDPYVQLSAVSIRAIHLSDYFSRSLYQPTPFLHDDVPPLLRRLRLHVDWFSLRCYCDDDILGSVDFRRLRVFNGFLCLKDLIPMGLQNCRELSFRTHEEHHFKVCKSLFTHTEAFSLDFFDKDECRGFIKELITSFQREKEVLGVLKWLRISTTWDILSLEYRKDSEFEEFIFTDAKPFHIFRIPRTVFDNTISFYRFPFDGGMAIVVHGLFHENYIEIFFVENDSRETLFDLLWRCFSRERPSDETFRHFMEAEDEGDAIDCLHNTNPNSFYHDY